MPKQSVFDAVAKELADWVDSTALSLADSFVSGGKVPFAAPVNEKQKIDYYGAQLFNEDSTPNETGRAQLLNKLGVADYARVFTSVVKARQSPLTGGELAGSALPAEVDNG